MAQLAASSSYSVRPAFQSSILHKLFNASEEETTCANQLYLRLDKTNLLSVNFIYRIAHSRLYRLWFLVATLFFTSTVILYQAEFMQHTVATCVVLVVCVVNLACSLTRIDRHLMRALSQTFEWPYLLGVLYTFIIFNSLAQQQVDVNGNVRPEQWSAMQINGFIQAIALCSPIAFLLANLDAIPLYPLPVKCGILFCGLAILLRVLVLDLINYARHGGTVNEATQLAPEHLLCIGTWACATVKQIGNLFAGQVSFFLLRHAYITINSMRGEKWKQMTILNVPLLIEPHFDRKQYTEEAAVASAQVATAEEEKAESPQIHADEDQEKETTNKVASLVIVSPKSNAAARAPAEEEEERVAPLPPPSLPRVSSVASAAEATYTRQHTHSSRTFSRMSIGSLNLTIDAGNGTTPGASRRQSVRIISVGPVSSDAGRRGSLVLGQRPLLPATPALAIRSSFASLAPPSPLSACNSINISPSSPAAVDLEMQLRPQSPHPSSPAAPALDMTTSPLPLHSPLTPMSPIALASPSLLPVSSTPPPPRQLGHARRHSIEGLAASMHRIDHRDQTQLEGRRIASEFAFEVGGYTQVLHEHAVLAEGATRDVMPWIFPVEFRPINPVRRIRKWVLRNRYRLETWAPWIMCVNFAAFAASTLLAAMSDAHAAHPALILHVAASLVFSIATMLLLGATVSDRTIFRHLVFKFEVWLTVYQVSYALITQLLLPTKWYMWTVLWFWYPLNIQVIFFDAAIWYTAQQKRMMVALAFVLGVLVFILDVVDRSRDIDHADESCFFTCTTLHVSSMYALMQSMVYQAKYIFKLTKNPRNAIILSVPVQYQGEALAAVSVAASAASSTPIPV